MEFVLDVEGLVALGRLGAFVAAPDGLSVIATVQVLAENGYAWVNQLWRVPVDGGPPERLLHGRFDDRAPAFRRDGALCFLSNRTDASHGPEDEPEDEARTQVWALLPDGALERLTAEPLGVSAFAVARTADVLVARTPVLPGIPHEDQRDVAEDLKHGPSLLRYRDMPVRYWDAWLGEKSDHLVAFTDHGRRDLTPDRTDAFPEWDWALSEDGARVVYGVRTKGVHRLWCTGVAVVEVSTGDGRMVLQHEELDLYGFRLSPDGSCAALSVLRWRQGLAPDPDLALLDLADGNLRYLQTGSEDQVDVAGWTRDGGSVLVTAPSRGRVPLSAVDAATGDVCVLLGEGTVHGVDVATDVVYVSRSDLLHPPGLVAVPLDGGALPRSLAPVSGLQADLAAHLRVEEFTVTSRDGTPVHGFSIRPLDAPRPPGLMWIHGGPIGAWSDGWHWRWCAALAAARGYAVFVPNPRGSLGYGQSFVQGIWGNVWGAACFEDLMAVADHIQSRSWLDGTRVVAMGGSFGGYMTNWIGTQTERFAALVTHAGLWDFQSFHGVTDHPAWWAYMFGLDPWTDTEELARYSPRTHADGWRSPVLILHGERDLRVPVGEAIAQFEALRFREMDVELGIFPDENHWIQKPRNIVAWYEIWLEFVERVVGCEEGGG